VAALFVLTALLAGKASGEKVLSFIVFYSISFLFELKKGINRHMILLFEGFFYGKKSVIPAF
jgi:hypothetical protein